MSHALHERLLRLDVCAVSDALDQLKLKPAVTGIIAQTRRGRICGPVTTVRLLPGTPPPGYQPRHLCTAAIEAAAQGGIVVVEQRTGSDAAGWGGILSNAAHMRGLAGVIIDGPARDIDEAADLGFPIYSRNTTARTARGRIYEARTGGPITIGHLEVNSGDWVVADSSGIAFLPHAQADEIVAAAERIAAREALMTKAVRDGQPVSAVMGADYEHMLMEQ